MAYAFDRLRGHLYARNWPECFRLAVAFGWKPAGTHPPQPMREGEHEDPNWSCSYFAHDYQVVGDDDAKKLSYFIYRAVEAIVERKELSPEQKQVIEEIGFEVEAGIHQVRELAAALEIADYAEQGPFSII